jgi:cytochrome c556
MNQHVMNVMDRTGHTTVSWDPTDALAVKAAKAKFDEYKRQGYTAFALENKETNGVTVDEKGRRLDTFDETVGKVLMIPQLRGG